MSNKEVTRTQDEHGIRSEVHVIDTGNKRVTEQYEELVPMTLHKRVTEKLEKKVTERTTEVMEGGKTVKTEVETIPDYELEKKEESLVVTVQSAFENALKNYFGEEKENPLQVMSHGNKSFSSQCCGGQASAQDVATERAEGQDKAQKVNQILWMLIAGVSAYVIYAFVLKDLL